MRVVLAQMEVIPGSPGLNTEKMIRMIGDAREQGADIMAFPEMAVPGYFIGDTWEQPSFLRDCEECGKRIADAARDIVVCFGNVGMDWSKRNEDGRVRKYNAFFVVKDGAFLGGENHPYPFRIKALHPNYREFDDTRHFYNVGKLALELGMDPGDLFQPVMARIGDKEIRLGCLLCEDGWSDDYFLQPMMELKARGNPDLFINLSASPFTLGKNGKRHRVFGRQVAETGVPLVYVNCVGLQNNGKTIYTFDGQSTFYSGDGRPMQVCPPGEETAVLIDTEFHGKGAEESSISGYDVGPEAIYRTIVYGIRHFLESINMKKVVIGLSGGIDSAVAACLYCQVLGPENVLMINMPSRFNSETTKGLAAALAGNLGCHYAVMPIQEAVELTVRQIEDTSIETMSTGGKWNLELTPFMKENIQARDRSARILAAASAAFGGGFTCNGNKAEVTVGYATLYGDQAGFLAALGDLWKHQVYELARYMNESVYAREVLPQGIIDIVPSAELSAEQAVDEGKGDPIIYPYHDYLFRSFVERWNRATPEDILKWYADGRLEEEIGCEKGLVSGLFPGPKEFIADLERWWKQYAGIGVAKRIQAPPILGVSRRVYGFDHREAQNRVYYTGAYEKLKAELLG